MAALSVKGLLDEIKLSIVFYASCKKPIANLSFFSKYYLGFFLSFFFPVEFRQANFSAQGGNFF